MICSIPIKFSVASVLTQGPIISSVCFRHSHAFVRIVKETRPEL